MTPPPSCAVYNEDGPRRKSFLTLNEDEQDPQLFLPGLRQSETEEWDSQSSAKSPLLLNQNPQPRDDSLTMSLQQPRKGLLFFRSLFFLSGLSASTWGRFGVIYYNQVKHLKPQQIGVLQAVLHSVGFLSVPLWGYLADIIQSRKQIYLLCNVMSTVSLLMLSFPFVDNFCKILICVFGMATFRCSAVLDALALDFLGDKHRGMYGSIRLYLPLAFGLGAASMGSVTDQYGFGWNFACFAFLMTLLLIFTTWGLPARSKTEQATYEWVHHHKATEEILNPEGSGADDGMALSTLANSLFKPPVVFWLLEVAVIGTGLGVVESFLFVFLQDELMASTKLCGFSVAITVLFEMPVFHYSPYLLRRLGHDALFLLAMLAYSIRVFGYSFLSPQTVCFVYLLEVLHGLTFASMWIASIDFSAAIAPKEWSTSVQSILTLTNTCLGGGLGPILGGRFMEQYGARRMFRGSASTMFVLLLVHAIVWRLCQRGHDDFLKALAAKKMEGQVDSRPEIEGDLQNEIDQNNNRH